MRRAAILAVALTALLAGAVLADRETAQFSAGRGDKALAAKKFDEAEGHFRKALEEDETFLPARLGLAQSLVGGGKTAPAVDELRKFLESARGLGAELPAEWKPLVAKAEKQLADIDALGNALQKLMDTYAENLADLGARLAAKDPVTAERALRRALRMKPGHARAVQTLEKMGKSSASEVIDLFNGKSLDGWESANPPIWQVEDGCMLGTARDGTFFVRSAQTFSGDFDVSIEAKVVEDYPGEGFFGVMPCWKADYDHYSFGVFKLKPWWTDMTDSKNTRTVVSISPAQMKKALDAKQWNTYTMQLRGNLVTAFVNGEEIGKEPRPANRRDGFVGLIVQAEKVLFRKVQVERR